MPGSAPRGADMAGRDAAHEEDAQFAVLWKQPVSLTQAGRRPDLCRLLAAARSEQGQLALTLQVDELGVHIAGDHHHLVEPTQCLRRKFTAVAGFSGWRPIRADELHRFKVDSHRYLRDLSHTASFFERSQCPWTCLRVSVPPVTQGQSTTPVP